MYLLYKSLNAWDEIRNEVEVRNIHELSAGTAISEDGWADGLLPCIWEIVYSQLPPERPASRQSRIRQFG